MIGLQGSKYDRSGVDVS